MPELMGARLLSWVPIAVILAIPLLTMSTVGYTWLVKGNQRFLLWLVLIVAASVGALAWLGVLERAVKAGNAILVATPLAQALIYATAFSAFTRLTGREPIALDVARNTPLSEGSVWTDRLFWICILLGIVLGASLWCVYLGVEWPGRGRAI